MRLRPSEVFYCQDSINNTFSGYPHRGDLIGKTLDDLCEGRCLVDRIPTIGVLWKDGKWITADNRRLWVFRHLERLGKCDDIPVKEIYYIPSDKQTSCNGGREIRVRRNPGGYWYLRPTVTRHHTVSPIQPRSVSSAMPSSTRSSDTRKLLHNLSIGTQGYRQSTFYTRNTFLESTHPLSPAGGDGSTFIDPQQIRYTKSQIQPTFDDGRRLQELENALKYGLTSSRNLPPLDVNKFYGRNFAMDGNRRLKVFKDVRLMSNPGLEVKVKITDVEDEDEDDFVDKIREQHPNLQLFDILNMGQSVTVVG